MTQWDEATRSSNSIDQVVLVITIRYLALPDEAKRYFRSLADGDQAFFSVLCFSNTPPLEQYAFVLEKDVTMIHN